MRHSLRAAASATDGVCVYTGRRARRGRVRVRHPITRETSVPVVYASGESKKRLRFLPLRRFAGRVTINIELATDLESSVPR